MDSEILVGEAYRRQGYQIEEIGGGGADGGVDLILQNRKGKTLVQCKRWRTQRVGVDKVRELYGVVMAENAAAGILVTTGTFTHDAESFAKGKPLTLVNGTALEQLVRDVQPKTLQCQTEPEPQSLGVSQEPLCPTCSEPMVRRTAKRGKNPGEEFRGCVKYPKCRGTRPV
ncbi:MAG: restriction endonuclease [Kiritimatiellia bacterium]